MADELTRPLGVGPKRKRSWIPLTAIAAPPAVLLVALGAWYAGVFAPTPAPPATVSGDETASIAAPAPEPAASVDRDAPPGLSEVVPDGAVEDVGGDVVIYDPATPRPVRLAALPREDLIEDGPYGPLPRIGDDGARPLDVYARPAEPERNLKPVAIVVGGIGIDDEASRDAIARLPGEVTLGFAPYGETLPDLVADARSAGHELLLQLPLEPYGYPATDPGPKTLTVDAAPEENLDRLAWLMSRLTSYVGAMNYMGARFSSDDAALKPVLAELAARGLLYVDDGSSGRPDLAGVAAGPALRADLVIDADTRSLAIAARLDQVAAIARERGYAIATGTAFPETVEAVAAFAAKARQKGLVLVPLTAIVKAGRT